jgi:hypothetical protein
MREELQTAWWSINYQTPHRVTETRYYARCEPHTMYAVACLACGDGPILSGRLAQAVIDADPQQLPQAVVDELIRTGWHWTATPYATGWVCCQAAGQSTSRQRR